MASRVLNKNTIQEKVLVFNIILILHLSGNGSDDTLGWENSTQRDASKCLEWAITNFCCHTKPAMRWLSRVFRHEAYSWNIMRISWNDQINNFLHRYWSTWILLNVSTTSLTSIIFEAVECLLSCRPLNICAEVSISSYIIVIQLEFRV